MYLSNLARNHDMLVIRACAKNELHLWPPHIFVRDGNGANKALGPCAGLVGSMHSAMKHSRQAHARTPSQNFLPFLSFVLFGFVGSWLFAVHKAVPVVDDLFGARCSENCDPRSFTRRLRRHHRTDALLVGFSIKSTTIPSRMEQGG